MPQWWAATKENIASPNSSPVSGRSLEWLACIKKLQHISTSHSVIQLYQEAMKPAIKIVPESKNATVGGLTSTAYRENHVFSHSSRFDILPNVFAVKNYHLAHWIVSPPELPLYWSSLYLHAKADKNLVFKYIPASSQIPLPTLPVHSTRAKLDNQKILR